MREGTTSPWWRGARGEWYVVAQAVLFGVVAFGPRTLPGSPPFPPMIAPGARIAGALLLAAGGALLLAGLLKLGVNVTPLPYPRERAPLVQSGPYALARHPMYAAVILLAWGWAFAFGGWLTLGYAAVLAIFLDRKAAREERWLVEKYPEYAEYHRRVSKFVPFVY